jgi:hypothetical protein
MDAVVLVRFQRQCFYIFSMLSVLSMWVLAPINWTAQDSKSAATLKHFSIRNVPDESYLLYFHFILSNLFTAVFFNTFMGIKAIRARYIEKAVAPRPREPWAAHHYSVLVRGIPVGYRTNEKVFEFFKSHFPEIFSAHMAKDIRVVWKALHKLLHTNGEQTPQDFHHIASLRRAQQAHNVQNPSNTCFVTFKTLRAASVCAAKWKPSSQRKVWTVYPAPAIGDIYWPNVCSGALKKRKYLVNFIYILFLFFSAPMVTIISGLTTLPNVIIIFPVLKPLLDCNEYLSIFLQGFLPTVALLTLLNTFPMLIQWLSTFRGEVQYSAQQKYVASRFYALNIFAILLVHCVSTSFVSQPTPSTTATSFVAPARTHF